LERSEKIRHATYDDSNHRLVVNESTSRTFRLIDVNTVSTLISIPQVKEVPLLVTQMAVSSDTLVYATGKAVVI
jgi:hypothetical protein